MVADESSGTQGPRHEIELTLLDVPWCPEMNVYVGEAGSGLALGAAVLRAIGVTGSSIVLVGISA